MSPLLALEGVSTGYGKQSIIDDLHCTIRVGEALGVVGGSGSGKTTLARLVSGLLLPAAGRILWEGEDISRVSLTGRRRRGVSVAMVFQDPQSSLDPRIPVWKTVTEPLALTRAPRRHRRDEAARLLSLVALGSEFLERRPHELSGGQRQRVAIARALCQSPKLVVLDEPTSALDVTVQATVLDLLANLRHELGLSYLFVTHDLHVMRRLCDRVMVMDGGRIVESGAPDIITTSPKHPYTRRLIAATPSMRARMDLGLFLSASDTQNTG